MRQMQFYSTHPEPPPQPPLSASARFWPRDEIRGVWFGKSLMPRWNYISGMQRFSMTLSKLRQAKRVNLQNVTEVDVEDLYDAALVTTLIFEQGRFNYLSIFKRTWSKDDFNAEFLSAVAKLCSVIDKPAGPTAWYANLMDPLYWNFISKMVDTREIFIARFADVLDLATHFVREEELRKRPDFWSAEFKRQWRLHISEDECIPLFGQRDLPSPSMGSKSADTLYTELEATFGKRTTTPKKEA